MKRNFRIKSVTPTIQSTSQKFLKSTVGFKKIKLQKNKESEVTGARCLEESITRDYITACLNK